MKGRALRRVLGALMGVAMVSAGAVPANAAVPLPQNDPFYQVPNPIPASPPGTVVRSRPVTSTGGGIPVPFTAWQLMFVSTDVNDQPSVATATVLLPQTQALTSPRPLVSYQMAEDGNALTCSPSYEMQAGTEKETPSLLPLLAQGWAVVVPDYEGMQSQYGVGVQAAHGVLDGIRAAENFGPLGLSGRATPVGLWGYSGGGLASAWATELAPTYAPDIRIVGVSEGGVPSDITSVAKQVDGGLFSGIELAAAVGISRGYPALTQYFNAKGKALAQAIGQMCIEQYVVAYTLQKLDTYTTVPDTIDQPPVQQIMDKVHLGHHRPGGPLYVFHSLADELIPVATAQALVAKYCSEGVVVDFYQDPASEHNSLAVSGAPGAIANLAARFQKLPVLNTCTTPPSLVTPGV